MIKNYYVLASIILTVIAMLPIVLFLFPKQIAAVRKKSNNKALHGFVLFLEIGIAITMVPYLPRAYQVLELAPVNAWAKLASISRGISYVFVSTLLLLIYFYKLKPEDE